MIAPATNTEIDLVIPDECEGCGVCCRAFNGIRVEDTDIIPEEFLESCAPVITEYGGVATHMLKMRENTGREGCSTCTALEEDTGRCSIYGMHPRVCNEFKHGSFLCRVALLMVNHGKNSFEAQYWPGHRDYPEPDGGYRSLHKYADVAGRKIQRRVIEYMGCDDHKPDEPSLWTCTHCFKQAATPERIKHDNFKCVPEDPNWTWLFKPWKWEAAVRWHERYMLRRRGALGWDESKGRSRLVGSAVATPTTRDVGSSGKATASSLTRTETKSDRKVRV